MSLYNTNVNTKPSVLPPQLKEHRKAPSVKGLRARRYIKSWREAVDARREKAELILVEMKNNHFTAWKRHLECLKQRLKEIDVRKDRLLER
jgi:hypothetical protein